MNRIGWGVLVAALFLWAMVLGPREATARPSNWTAPKAPLLYRQGTVDTGAAGQVELVLATVARATYGWELCNNSADEILVAADATFGVELIPLPDVTPGSSGVAMDPVTRLTTAKPCLDSGDFSGQTLILQADDTNGLVWSIVGKQ